MSYLIEVTRVALNRLTGDEKDFDAAWDALSALEVELASLRSEVERLTRERGKTLADRDQWKSIALDQEAKLTTLTAITREVLAPFAEAAGSYDPPDPDDDDDDYEAFAHIFSIGQLRAARSLSNEIKETKK